MNSVQNTFDLKEPLECKPCKTMFNNNHDFGFHSKYHNKDGYYTCHFCKKLFSKKDHFRTHLISHREYKCDICSKTFKRKSTALNHVHKWEKLYLCKICGKKLSSSWSLNSHIKHMHHEKFSQEFPPKFQCKICKKHYRYENGLKLHYSSQHKEFGIDFSVECEICGKSISCKSKLKQHLRIHTGDKPYSCSQCPRKFSTKDLIASHMRVHTGEKPYVCIYCGKKFAQGASYRYHLKTHTGEKSYSCEICGKTFISNGNMKIHFKSCSRSSNK